jgi:hypothetical protein
MSTASEFGHAAYSKYTSSLYRLIKFSSEYCKNYSNAQISLELARYEVRKMAFSIHLADFSKLALVNRKKGLSLEIGICTCIRVIFLIWQTRTLKFNYKTKQKLIMLEPKDVPVLTVSPGMLFRRLFMATNKKKLFGNPDWYIKWLGMIDRLHQAWCSDLRIPPSLLCDNPPPQTSWNLIGMSMVMTVSLVYLPA